MKSCEHYQELISAMLDGELLPSERAEMEAHLAECDECSEMCVAFAAVTGATRLAEEPRSLHADIMAKIDAAARRQQRARILRSRPVLAAAACLVVIVGAVLALRPGRTAENTSSQSAATAADLNVGMDLNSGSGAMAGPQAADGETTGGTDTTADAAPREYDLGEIAEAARTEEPAEAPAMGAAAAGDTLVVEVVAVNGTSFTATVLNDPVGIFAAGETVTVVADGQAAGLHTGDHAALSDYTLELSGGDPVLTAGSVSVVE